jgi:hypothetical protein
MKTDKNPDSLLLASTFALSIVVMTIWEQTGINDVFAPVRFSMRNKLPGEFLILGGTLKS